MDAYKEFIEAINVSLDGVNDERIVKNTETKTIRLVFEIARSLGFGIRETDLQTTGYASSGWAERERLLMDSQKAMRDVATQLMLQTRLNAGAQLSLEERRYIGIPDESQ
ncbi:hypothetical protein GCM10011515_10060 [Tsuneonella deserti]|uniref:DUF6680 domain-containing protein n=2 Tax=Tsuneonella deserti TaxID=2035528 RepID=A0ABQ1S3L2_9SPHN|nr:hypothetical protein GCM10011515_10060 [Tsuneonella deserti]